MELSQFQECTLQVEGVAAACHLADKPVSMPINLYMRNDRFIAAVSVRLDHNLFDLDDRDLSQRLS